MFLLKMKFEVDYMKLIGTCVRKVHPSQFQGNIYFLTEVTRECDKK